MPYQKIAFVPGINRQKSQTLNEGGWSDASLVRFRDGLPQKFGGWQSIISTAFNGICRALLAWQQLNGFTNIGIGTNTKYYILQGGAYADITPLDPGFSPNPGTLGSNPFVTTAAGSGTTTVTVTHSSHARSIGDSVWFNSVSAFDGTSIAATSTYVEYTVASVPDSNHYTITVATTGSAGATGGGASVGYQYLIPIGSAGAVFGAGWGAPAWGGGIGASGTLGNNPFTTVNTSATVSVAHTAHGQTLGSKVVFSGASTFNNVTMNGSFTITAVTDANNYTVTAATTANANGAGGGAAVAYTYYQPGWGNASTTTSILTTSPRVWSHQNWGQDLIHGIRDSWLCYWTATNGTSTRSVTLHSLSSDTNAPKKCKAVIVGLPERHVIVLGSDQGTSTIDPLLIHWSDVENFTGAGSWTASATNSAGTFRLGQGTQLVGCTATQQGVLVWTDTTLYLMQFIGTPLVYSFRPQGGASGLIGPNASIEVNGTVYWMSQSGIFAWRGAIQKLEPTLYQDVFGTGSTAINRNQAYKIFCGLDSGDNEILWFYPSVGGTGECDRYLAYNFVEDTWYGGALPRTAYIDRGLYPYPIATDPSGVPYYHEIGVDANGAGMSVYLESGYVDLSSGDEFIAVNRIIPDFEYFSGTVSITFKAQAYPGGPIFTKGPYTVSPSTKFIRTPIRGRQVAIRITSSNVGDWFRLGALRVQTQPDGRR